MGATTTAKGITSKHVLLSMETGQIMSLPLRALDPRRPEGEPSKSEKAEGLAKYTPFIHINPVGVVSYNQTVAGVRLLQSSPARLESTSLVLAAGLDTFFTRVTPSKAFDMLAADFNYLLLLLTVLGLVVTLAIIAAMNRMRKLKGSWR